MVEYWLVYWLRRSLAVVLPSAGSSSQSLPPAEQRPADLDGVVPGGIKEALREDGQRRGDHGEEREDQFGGEHRFERVWVGTGP